MTKLREPLSHNSALDEIVACIGWPAAERATGRGERAIRKWSEPDVKRVVPIDCAIALDIAYIEATGAPVAPFEAFYQLKLQLARARAVHAATSAAEILADAHRETGEAFAAHALASCPGADAQARRGADREIDEAIVALARIRAGTACASAR